MKILKRFSQIRLNKEEDYNLIVGIFMLMIPLLLILVNWEVRGSISDYVYASPLFFSSCLTVGAVSFFRNGYVKRTSNWFDMIIGASLLGVAWTPHLDYPILHYTFAGIFFLGNTFNMVYFTSARFRSRMFLLALVIILALSGYFLFALVTLFFAEWIGMLPMSINYISESLGYSD